MSVAFALLFMFNMIFSEIVLFVVVFAFEEIKIRKKDEMCLLNFFFRFLYSFHSLVAKRFPNDSQAS